MPDINSPNYAVPALEKGLDILEALSASTSPLTLSNLSRILDRNNAEIFRMLNLLERRRYVLRDDSGAYRLSLKLFQIANTQCNVRQLIDAALPHLRDLTLATSESCHLSVLEDAEMVVLARAESPSPVKLTIEVGSRFSAVTTTSGRMLLAGLQPEMRKRVLQQAPAYHAMKPQSQSALLKLISKIAAQEFSTAENETVNGVLDAAVAVGSPESGIHAAIAISALHPSSRKGDAKRFVPHLRLCRQKIDSAIGCHVHRESGSSQTH